MADQDEIFKQVSPQAIGGIVNFAMGAASRLLKEKGDIKGADSLSAGAKDGDINAVLGGSLDPRLMPGGSKGNEAEEAGSDEKMVSAGAGLAAKGALTACGVPPPASDIIGDKIGQAVGKAYAQAKEKMEAVNPVAVTTNVLESLSEGLEAGMKEEPEATAQGVSSGVTNAAVNGADDVAEKIVEVIEKSIGAIMEGAEKALTAAAAASTGGISMMASGAGGKGDGSSESTPTKYFPGPATALKSPGGGSSLGPVPSLGGPRQDKEDKGSELSMGMKPRPKM